MLYGNIIFIKKTGGDGSKYPVSEKSVKIGRSEECLIRIYNTQVALEHCQLIIGENGQATLKDLSKQTLLNGNILAHEEATLCHGDVFKVGERLARWEYLPTSKYYRQLLSPTGRLVAVVMPQQRCLEDQSSGTSASFVSGPKNTPVGGKRRYSERFASETTSAVKMRKSSSSSLNRKSKGDLSKFLTGRHSLKTKKLLLPLAKMNVRKSTSGSINSRTPKGKSRKSTLPSWKINTVSPATAKLTEEETSLSMKSHGKSVESCSSTNKNLLKDTLDQESEKLSTGKKRIRSPQKTTVTCKEIVKSTTEIILTSPVKISVDSPLKIRGSTKSTGSVNKSSSPRKSSLVFKPSSRSVRLIHSEKKPKHSIGKSSVPTRELKRLSLILSSIDKNKGNKESPESFSHEELKSLGQARGIVSDLNVQSTLKYNNKKGFPNEKEWSSLKMKTPAVDILETSLNDLDDVIDSKKEKQVLHSQNKSLTSKSTPLKKTPKKLEKSVGKPKPSSSRKNLSKSPSRSSTSAANSASARSPKSSSVRISLRKTINLSKERISSPRGVRRKLSPSISSAERAAKKLKTSSPKKPDKNKKAALLVLGKANRKQLLAQNVKVLLKQKIVKKAIKQSTTAGADKTDNGKKRPFTDVKGKPRNVLQRKTSEAKKKVKKNDSSKRNTPENSSKSAEVPQIKNEMEFISKGENALEENMLNNSEGPEKTLRSPSKFKNLLNEVPGKALWNQYTKSESPQSSHYMETSLPYGNFEKAAGNFLFNSNRRCSKRLSSKNDLGRPDFVELSPTALGLIPKNIEAFKSPVQNKRRSSSLVTPKIVQSIGIIKSASTSKIGNRKNVRFSSKDISLNSEFCSPSEKTDFDFGTFQTPDVSVDVFISPLGDKTSGSKKGLNESSRVIFTSEDNSEVALACRSNSEPRKCIRKLLQSPQSKKRVSYNRKEVLRDSRPSAVNVRKLPIDPGKSERDSSSFDVEVYTTPQNNLSNTGVLRLLRSPKNDSIDVKRVKKLLKKPKVQKSPKNDLSDVRGVKKLLATPKVQKSPKNDLSDVRGVKKLLATPKVQKSPKNDLSDVRGVKKLLATPKVQKSPKNDLSDVRGVKKLLATPKVQKSPKNDLSDVRGVKKLLATPEVHKSPKNDLSDVRGVKKLLATPKVQKSPKNDLSDVRGVKKLLATPKVQKSPKNNLTEVTGIKELFKSPRIQKSPKNELLDLSGIRQLLESPKLQKSSKNYSIKSKRESIFEFLEQNLIKSPKNQKLSKDSAEDLKEFSESGKFDSNAAGDILNVDGMEQALKIGKSGSSVPKNQKSISRKSRAGDFRAVKEGRSTYASSKEPKNDLSDVMGVRELFIRHKPGSDFNESLTGLSQLFSLPEEEMVSTLKGKTSGTKSKTQAVQKIPKVARPKRGTADKDEYIQTRRSTRGILRKASAEETTRRSARDKKLKIEDGLTTELTERKPAKRKAAERTKASKASKSSAIVKRSERIKNGTKRNERTAQVITKAEPEHSGVTKTRKRKVAVVDTASPPPKMRRKNIAESVKKTTRRSKTALVPSEKISIKKVRKASEKVKNETSKSSSRAQSKTSKANVGHSLKVQKNRSQSKSKKNLSDSQENLSPMKTRSAKKEAASRRNRMGRQKAPAGNKVPESTGGRKKVTPVVKKSTRRK